MSVFETATKGCLDRATETTRNSEGTYKIKTRMDV